ncbi:transglycosylase SLT domain-containing protein [Niveibacterium sp. 24ML]|uniref:transglycosylase SLT domain-containing protein n=1 Tax=Niveibacterium sp. 24ML TaxID=2985512 RepID=UPI00226F5FFD|nr:transglycosylase SLT domain-containing protein [Niveibacterium sp. 24ML]MCX9156920.1 transglycosylase SLT domain-containing protein [Niveibacterium sp. 24ML]
MRNLLSLALGLLCLVSGATADEAKLADPRASLARQLVALGTQYEHGEGMPQDPLRAAELYCDAARYGDAEALFALAWMYGNGRGVERDERIAATLMTRAAEAGYEPAQGAQRFFGPSAGVLPACMTTRPAQSRAEAVASEDADLDALLAGLPANKQRVAQLIRLLAPQYAIDARLALAVAAAESNFESLARSPRNAYGVMQLIPDTAQRFKVRNIYDPSQNIKGGLAYLRWLLSYYRGDVLLALAAYNAGEGAVDRYRGIPPYRETVDYVKRIYGMFGRASHPFDAQLVAPSPIMAAR